MADAKYVDKDNLRSFKTRQDAYNENKFAQSNSPTFTGNPTAPTKTKTDNSDAIATTKFVQTVVAESGGGSGAGISALTEEDIASLFEEESTGE